MLISIVLLGMLFLTNSFAVTANTFGIVDIQKIMQVSPKIKAAGDRLKAKFASQQRKIASKQQALRGLLTKLNRDASVMSDSAKQKLQTKITAARKEYGAILQNYEQKVMSAQQQEMQKIATSIQGIAAKIAKQNNLAMVVVKQAVIYAGNAKDITDQVIKAMK
jgi:outer membrane protein